MQPNELYADLPFLISGPAFCLHADGRRFSPATMSEAGDDVWRDDDVEIRLVRSRTQDGSRAVVLEADGVRHVSEVCLLDGAIKPVEVEIHNHVWFNSWDPPRSTVLFLRGSENGLFACYANPFGAHQLDGERIRLSYRPAMDVEATFRSDPLIVGATELEGRAVRLEMLRGRDVVDGTTAGYADVLAPQIPTELDAGEIRAVRAAVAARTPWQPARARSAHWDWGENTFRLDIADPGTRAVYDRLTRLCDEWGIENLLISPGNPATTDQGMDANMAGQGPWQSIMWLGHGTEVGAGSWQPGEPEPVAEVIEQARARGLDPVAYANPQYLWLREDRWRVVRDPDPEDPDAYQLTCLAVPEARRWLIDTARRFADQQDLGGYSFDFVFWLPCHATDHGHEPGADSRYAQWDGYRQLMAELRDAFPEAWLESLIGGLELLPWGAVDATHPHPNMGDNQPQWVPAWPDLSLDRTAANFQRRAAFWFRNFALVPSYKVPGQVGHQANRMHFFTPERGWDWEGARYNLLSAIASGPSSLSVCFLPCWDENEWDAVRSRDGEFFREWIRFAGDHARVLARLEDVFEEPRPGAVDATMALDDDGTGFVFLANPDYTEHVTDVPLPAGSVLRERYPRDGRLWGGAVTVEPHTVTVLDVVPGSQVELPAVFGVAAAIDLREPVVEHRSVPGAAAPVGGRLGAAEQTAAPVALRDASGVPGSRAIVALRLPEGEQRRVELQFASDGVTPTLGPWQDANSEGIDLSTLDGKARISTRWVPGESLPGLLADLAPPIRPVGDETRNPWSDPSRLRLFPALRDPKTAKLRMWIDGHEVEIHETYVGTYEHVSSPQTAHNNLLGYYADLTRKLETTSDLTRPWRVELDVSLAWPGQLTGVHVAHLPRRTTTEFEVIG